jgi:hypothetical protein
MKRLIALYATFALALAVALASKSFVLMRSADWYDFESNLLLNVVAEFVGFSFGIVAAAHLATRAAQKKVDELAEPVLALIRHLREGGTISPPAARAAVVTTVKIISEKAAPRTGGIADSTEICSVCALGCKLTTRNRCRDCGLPGRFWSSLGSGPASVQ